MSHAAAVNGTFATMGVLLLSTAVSARLRSVDDSPARTALTASLGTMGVSFLVQTPAAREIQNVALTNLGQLTGNGTTLIAAYAMQVMMLHILYDRGRAAARCWWWSGLLVAALASLTACFLRTPTRPDVFTSPEAPGGVLAYYLVYTGYLAVTLIAMALLLRRYAAQVGDRWLRLSLRLYGWACVIGLCYLAGRIGNLVIGRLAPDLVRTGEQYGTLEFLVASAIPATAMTLVLAAVTIRSVGRWRHYRQTDRRLRPLWEAVRDARPHAVLPVSRGGGARLRLYRRVVEIQDGQLAAGARVAAPLRADIDEAVAEAGLVGDAADATRQAAVLAAGLAALHDGHPVTEDPDASATAADDEPDLAGVVRQLERVSTAFTESDVVRRFAGPQPAPTSR